MLRSFAPMLLVVTVAMTTAAGLVRVAPSPEPGTVADINHSIHIERDLMCVDCHQGVETRAAAGVPSITICTECHDDPEDTMGKTANGKLILSHIAAREELWWPQLYSLPGHVVFSHRRHVALGKVACEKCHDGIAKTTTLPKEPVRATLTMDGCLECHAASGASRDCLTCHK